MRIQTIRLTIALLALFQTALLFGQAADISSAEKITAYTGEMDESFYKQSVKLAQKCLAEEKYQCTIDIAQKLRQKFNEPAVLYLLIKAYYNSGEYRWTSVYARRFTSDRADENLDVLKMMVSSLIITKSYGQAVQNLNRAIKLGFLKENQYYYENMVFCYSKMGASAYDVYKYNQEGLVKFPDSVVLLDLAIDHALRFGEVDKAAAWGKTLAGLLPPLKPGLSVERNVIIKPDKLSFTTLRGYMAPYALGRSANRIELSTIADRKLISDNLPANEKWQLYGQKVAALWDGIVYDYSSAHREHPAGKADMRSRGNYIVLMHGLNRYTYIYNIQPDSNVKRGNVILKGDIIGTVSTQGRFNYPAIVIEVRDNGAFKGNSYPLEVK